MKKHPKLLNVRKDDGYGPLHLACLNDNYSTVKFLLEQVCMSVQCECVRSQC